VKRMTPVSVLLKRGAVTGAGWGAKKIRGYGQVNALIRQV
jgi:CRISPR/Cas system CMR subunit Cmr6 (Cas7 group RAMP superfamily)